MDEININDREDTNVIRYKVSMKKAYKIGYFILGAVSVIAGIYFGIYFMSNQNISSAILCSAFFILLGLSCIIVTRKKLSIYKGGRIVYCNCLWNTTYKFSDVYKSNSKITEVKAEYGQTTTAGGWDKITTFYDSKNKKLFCFGLAFDNVDRFQQEVNNCQKSIKNRKRK